MAGDRHDKTEKPTAKKLKDSRKDGKVVRSEDLVSWTSLLVATVVLPGLISRVSDVATGVMADAAMIAEDPDVTKLPTLFGQALWDMFMAILPAIVALGAIAVVANLAQVGVLFTTKPLKPKISHLNPIQGIKRIFSVKSLWQTVNSVLKLLIIVLVSWVVIKGMAAQLMAAPLQSAEKSLHDAAATSLMLVRAVASCALSLGIADYAFQKYQMTRDLKMSKHEIKQEHRESEGDPHLKGKQRQIGRAMSGNRMLAAVTDADVVITNPTHLAIAIGYEAGSGAPKVLARGADGLAGKIRERATEAGIPLVEAKPLARALYLVCRADEEIPTELYQGVATVLAFLHRLGATHKSMGGRLSLNVPDSWTPGEGNLERVTPTQRKRRAREAIASGSVTT